MLARWGAGGFRRALGRRCVRHFQARIRASQTLAILEAWKLRTAEARRLAAAHQLAFQRFATTSASADITSCIHVMWSWR